MARDVILTGIPRSGTTLAATLLDSAPDTVCLHEPLWQTKKFPSGEVFANWLVEDFAAIRQKLLRGEPVEDRRDSEGKSVTNYYRREGDKMENTFALMPFTRPGLSEHFTLAIKHNGPYLAILGELVKLQRFSIIAIIRHPVEVLHSWRRLDLPVSRGEMPGAVAYWPRMAEIIRDIPDLLERQVKMYDAMCRRIFRMRDYVHVLPYETLIGQPELLYRYAGVGGTPPALIQKPERHIPREERDRLITAVKAHGESYREFYPDLA